MKDIPIILLAAGQSSRMQGADKLLLKVDGVPLLRRAVLIARGAGPVIVALPPAPHPRHDAVRGLDIAKVEIENAAEGMNASLRGALRHLPPDAPAVMVMLSDLPDLQTDDLRQVMRARLQYPDKLIWRGATIDGTPGHPVIFDRSLFRDLAKLVGDGGARSLVKKKIAQTHLEPLPGSNAIRDLDTREDWATWQALHRPQK